MHADMPGVSEMNLVEPLATDVECYRVEVPDHSRLAGFTAAGQWVQVVPGEHVVHRVKPKVPLPGFAEALRFLGADRRGHDVHVPVAPETTVEALVRPLESGTPRS